MRMITTPINKAPIGLIRTVPLQFIFELIVIRSFFKDEN
jgi:hypothetical protein